MDVPAEAIELGNRDGAFTVPAGLGESGGELRAALDRVGALAGLDLDELADDLVTLGGCESGNRGALGIDPETRAALLASADPEVGDQRLGHDGDPRLRLCIDKRENEGAANYFMAHGAPFSAKLPGRSARPIDRGNRYPLQPGPPLALCREPRL